MSITYRPVARSFWLSVGIVITFNCLFLILTIFKPGSTEQFVLIDDTMQAIGWLIGAILCFVGFAKPWEDQPFRFRKIFSLKRDQRWVPIFLSLGIFCQFIGQVIYTYYDFHHWSNFPSLADIAYMSTFPCFLISILVLPTYAFSGITRSRVFVDAFMIMVAIFTFSWYFILGPTMLQGHETVLAKFVGSYYPFVDLVLIFCVLLLTLRSSDPVLRPAILLLSVGLIIIVITDSIYDIKTLQNTYTSGWQDVGWPIGYMLLALAAQIFSLTQRQETEGQSRATNLENTGNITQAISQTWFSMLPYAFIPAVLALALYVWELNSSIALKNGVYLGSALLILLVLIRQFFAFQETIYYNKELRLVEQELHLKNLALIEANSRLELQSTQVAAAYEQQLRLNELKDQFLLNVNHELRTPLTEIQGYLNLLSEYQGQLDASIQLTFINHAIHGCEELQRLVNNVLEAIRGDFLSRSPQIEDHFLAPVVREVLDLFEPQKRLEYSIEVNIQESIIIQADEQHLRQILLNLLSNAFKYSPKKSTIMVSAEVKAATTLSETTSSEVVICVQDTGPGIPPSEIPMLFGKFVRLKRDLGGAVRGTGLGLYICKQLIEAMGGRIWVESSGIAGEGSRFYFVLPSVPYHLHQEKTQLEGNNESALTASDVSFSMN